MTQSASPDGALILVNARGWDKPILKAGRVKRKRTQIVFELDEVLVVSGRQTMAFAWCAECCDQVQLLTPDHAATIAGLTPRLIYQWVEAGRLHFSETSEGQLLICENSLPMKQR